jgi:hypothetical protein
MEKIMHSQFISRIQKRSIPWRIAAVLALAITLVVPQGSTHASAFVAAGSPGVLVEGDVIYQVLVDRFSNGNTANDNFGYGDYNPSNFTSI